MASLRRTPAGTYVVCFRFSGTQYQRSLKTRSTGDAKDVLKRVESQLYRLGIGELSVPAGVNPADFIVNGKDKAERISVQEPVPASFDDLCDSYLADQPGRKADSTLATERTHLKNLRRALGNHAEKPLSKLTAQQLNCALRTRRQKVTGSTVMKERQTLLSFLAWGCENGHLPSLPDGKLKTFETNGDEDRFRTRADIETLLRRGGLTSTETSELWKSLYLDLEQASEILSLVKQQARHDFIFPMVALAAFTGMRRGEILRLRWADIDLKHDVVTAISKKQSRQKAETRRAIPIHPELKTVLEAYQQLRPRGQHVICSGNTLAPLTKDMAHHHLHQSLRRTRWEVVLPHMPAYGEGDEKPPTKVVIGFHTFRHSLASNLASKGVDQRLIDQIMGHQTEEMRNRYQHLFPKDRQACVNSLELRVQAE